MPIRPIFRVVTALAISGIASSCHHATRARDPQDGVCATQRGKSLEPRTVVGPPAFRLPTTVHPTHYALDLTIDPEAARASGKITIAVHLDQPADTIWLHAADLAISSATIGGSRATPRLESKGDLLGLIPDHHHIPFGDTTIEIAFTSAIDHARSRGIYAEKEGDRTYAYTFFESIDARRAFPCFDEPAFKVPWQLTFHVKADQIALGNAPVVKETPEAGNMKRVELADSKPMPSYLVAFVVGPFAIVDDGTAGRDKTPIRFIVPQGREPELAWAKDVTPRIVDSLEHYFDMAYPFGKLDVAVVPRYWGTMEHPGIVAMGQPLTLIRPDQATRGRKENYANILAHELSHYWFGDYVTMAWWDDTWLNEALGEWSDMNITDATEPGWHVRDDRPHMSESAMSADETLAARAMRQPVTSAEGIQASFDNDLVYYKGASLFRMFEAYVGPDKWREFINAYLAAHAWGNASANDFLVAAKTLLGAPIEAGLKSFIDQPGVPRVAMTIACTGQGKDKTAELQLTQSRSLHAGDIDPKPDRVWSVPVCVRYGAADGKPTEQCQLLTAKAATMALASCPTWIVPNVNANGYYRSVVAPEGAVDAAPNMTVAERVMRVLDRSAAVERGEVTIDRRLAAARIAIADPAEKVAIAGIRAGAIDAHGLPDKLVAKSRAYLVSITAPIAKRLGWVRGPKDTDERHELRMIALGAAARLDPATSRQARALATTWLAKRTGLSDDLVGIALGATARTGTAADFDRIVDAAKHARDRTEQTRLLQALGSAIDPALVARDLAIIEGTEFDLRDSLGMTYTLMYAPETRDTTLAWLEAKLPALVARMRSDDAAGYLGFLAGATCDEARLARIEKLVTPLEKGIDGAANSVTRGLEQAHQCILTTARDLGALEKFLAKY